MGLIRMIFLLLSTCLMAAYTHSLIGAAAGAAFGLAMIGAELLLRRSTLRSLNVVTLGLFFGCLFGLALTMIFNLVVPFTEGPVALMRVGLMMLGVYFGVMMTMRAADHIAINIPFIRLSKVAQRTRELILDPSILADERFVDLAGTGLLDRRLVLPRFIIQDLYSQAEHPDELAKKRALRSLEVIKRLDELPYLAMQKSDIDYGEVHDPVAKLTRLARQTNCDILTANATRIQQIEGIRMINIHDLSKALKPLMQNGEFLHILIQRYGKEEHQGVGYLEDGTMVVVNGGGDYLGEEVNTRVISVKRTAAGRIIFCNVEDR